MKNRYERVVEKIRTTGFILPFMFFVAVVSGGGVVTGVMDYYSSYRGVWDAIVNTPPPGTFEYWLVYVYAIVIAIMPQAVGAACLYIVISISPDFTIEKYLIGGAVVLGLTAITYDLYTGYNYHAHQSVRHIYPFTSAFFDAGPQVQALVWRGFGLTFVVDFVLSEIVWAVFWGLFWELIPDAKVQWAKVTGVLGAGSLGKQLSAVPPKEKKKQPPQQGNSGPRVDPAYGGRPPQQRPGGGGRPDQREAMNQMNYGVPPDS